jgi:hypothetical protein
MGKYPAAIHPQNGIKLRLIIKACMKDIPASVIAKLLPYKVHTLLNLLTPSICNVSLDEFQLEFYIMV